MNTRGKGLVPIAVLVIGSVVDLRRSADVLGPVPRPVVVLCGDLCRCLGVSTDGDTVDQTANQRQEAKDQEYDAENPEQQITVSSVLNL